MTCPNTDDLNLSKDVPDMGAHWLGSLSPTDEEQVRIGAWEESREKGAALGWELLAIGLLLAAAMCLWLVFL